MAGTPKNRLDSPSRLAALEETGLLDALPQASLDRFTRIASAAIGVPVALVSLVDPRRQFFSSLVGLPEPWASKRETPLTHSFCKTVVETGDELVVTDAKNDARVAGNLAITELGVQAYAGKPIHTADGEVLGSFCVIDSKPRVWTTSELLLLGDICDAVIGEVDLRRRSKRHELSEGALGAAHRELESDTASKALADRQMLHDLRAPLNVISMGAKLLRMHDANDVFPEMDATLEKIDRNAAHMVSILAALEATGVDVGPVVASDLAKVVREVASDSSRTDIVVGHDIPHAPILVALGETAARRCIGNLVVNALRFANKTVIVALRVTGAEVEVSVEDDGPGLPGEDACTNVWRRGVRYHVESGKSGTGLGLAIVKELVEAAGGKVSAGSSSSFGGARFAFTLPIVRARG
ncbi:MAG TPA: GAF domain-containing sensor histidine kinase [Polyangiaceae bacterium]